MTPHPKIAVIDPSLFTLPYDVHLCSGIAEATGAEVTLFGRELRPGELCNTGKFTLHRWFYAASSRLEAKKWLPKFLRNAIKACEHVWDTLRLLMLFRKKRPAIVHYQWFPIPLMDQFAVRWLRRRGIPVIWTVHDTTPFNAAPTSQGQNLGWERSLSLPDALIVHTEQSRQRLLEMGVTVPIGVVPHGVLSFGEAPPCNGHSELSILFFGAIRPYKGLDLLLRAFAAVKEKRSARLKIVGNCSANARAEFEHLIRTLGIADQTTFECRFFRDEEIPALMADADLVVFPYRRIDASGAFLTAIAYGKPFLATDVGLFSEFVKDRQDALLAPDSVEELTQKIQQLILEPGKLSQLRSIASQIRSEISDWTEIGERTMTVYEKAGLRH